MNSSVTQDELIQNSKLKVFQNDMVLLQKEILELPKNATPVDLHTQYIAGR